MAQTDMRILLSVFCTMALSPAYADDAVPTDAVDPRIETVTPPYALEKKLLPKVIFRLFYAVKESLDYASVTGDIYGEFEDIPEDPPPKETLEEYERVTRDLLEEVDRSFIIEKYATAEWDYELVVRNRKNKEEKYKASRIKMFRFNKGEWESLGMYSYW